jgi:hypothetical protein
MPKSISLREQKKQEEKEYIDSLFQRKTDARETAKEHATVKPWGEPEFKNHEEFVKFLTQELSETDAKEIRDIYFSELRRQKRYATKPSLSK